VGIETTLSAWFGKKLAIAGQMMGDGEQSSVHNLLQSDGESTDLERLLLLSLGQLGLLQTHIPKPVVDEVELAEGDPHAQLHLLWLSLKLNMIPM
jgi:hypothetical protein